MTEKGSPIREDIMKQGEAYNEALFDLAIQNMLKRTIARGIAEQKNSESMDTPETSTENAGVTKVSVIAEVKPIMPSSIKNHVIADVRSLEENNVPDIIENQQNMPIEGEIDYLVKIYNRISPLNSTKPPVPSVPKSDGDTSEQKDSEKTNDKPSDSPKNKNKNKDNEKGFLDYFKDLTKTIYNLGANIKEISKSIDQDGKGVGFDDISREIGKRLDFKKNSGKIGKLIDDVVEKFKNIQFFEWFRCL